MNKTHSMSTILAVSLLASLWFVGLTSSARVYNPWYDLDEDGDIDIYDIVRMAECYGTSGEPLEAKAAIEYDSGWIDITDKCGQYLTITHNLNTTDIIVDIQGLTIPDGGVHQRHIGGTGYIPGWSKTYGGTVHDSVNSVIQTSDEGYALAGSAYSYGAGMSDFWLVKTDATGNVQWNKTYGGTNWDDAHGLVQTVDGGYAVAGYTGSFGAGVADVWLAKTNDSGNMEWNKTYGGAGDDAAFSVVHTADGGYALAGYTCSYGDVNGDSRLVKTSADGNVQWNKTYGGAYDDIASSLVQTDDGGYALAGYTSSYSGLADFWLIKTDADGNAQWNKTYDRIDSEWAYSVIQTSDAGYALAGGTGNPEEPTTWNFWLVKTDTNGNAQWNKTYGGTDCDYANSLVQTGDGGYALAGITCSYGDFNGDSWLVKTDATGNMQWNKTYGGIESDWASSVIQTSDGKYALAGTIGTYAWLMKTDEESGLAWTDSTADTITLHRGATDAYWNYVRVRIWKIKETP